VEEVAAEVMQVDKTTKLFQTMVIMISNMGNLYLEVSSLNNKFATKMKEKVILHVELDKEKDFQKEYKHNIKYRGRTRQKMSRRSKHSYKK
jgi:regulator of replication initiation timing